MYNPHKAKEVVQSWNSKLDNSENGEENQHLLSEIDNLN